jgi:pimeloyl-ACP methyl ester carboxylesterase
MQAAKSTCDHCPGTSAAPLSWGAGLLATGLLIMPSLPPSPLAPLHHIVAGNLSTACHLAGPANGPPVFLMHGFPYDIHAYADVAPRLVARGCRVVVPYLRGFGPTRFLRDDAPRSGEQAVLGQDLRALMDALQIERAVLAGYDWGGRAACVVAALWPQRCAGLLSFNSYNIQEIAQAMAPDTPENEHRLWYQYFFHSERGRRSLAQDRRAVCRLLWRLWSPTWQFDEATFQRSALAFDNPDFVDVVIHSYRHRFGLVPGDPAVAAVEEALARQPPIAVRTISFDGADDGVRPPAAPAQHGHRFTGERTHVVLPGVGHNMPQEVPDVFADAVLSLVRSAWPGRLG